MTNRSSPSYRSSNHIHYRLYRGPIVDVAILLTIYLFTVYTLVNRTHRTNDCGVIMQLLYDVCCVSCSFLWSTTLKMKMVVYVEGFRLKFYNIICRSCRYSTASFRLTHDSAFRDIFISIFCSVVEPIMSIISKLLCTA